jgi:membrane fusion protein (multidrug efflux system)
MLSILPSLISSFLEQFMIEMIRNRYGLLPIFPLVLISTLLIGCHQDKQANNAAAANNRPPPEVVVGKAQPMAVTVRAEYPGRVLGIREIQVRARVGGILLKRLYNEGQMVKQGDVLFQIDPEPFQVALRQAQAQLQRAQADSRQAQRNYDRVMALYKADAVSTQERDQAISDREVALANVKLAEAQVAQAQLNLGYASVQAPQSGVTSLEVLNEGNLINTGDLLTTITQLDPVQVRFSLPENDAIAQREARQAMAAGNPHPKRDVELIFPGGQRYAQIGQVDFTQSTIDPQTGTVLSRAIFPNAQRNLTPGQFVRIDVHLFSIDNAIVVPPSAVDESDKGAIVYIVDADSKVHAKPVRLGPVVKEGQVIEAGLEPGEQVVVEGIVKVRDGMPVKVKMAGKDSEEKAG